MTVEAIFEDEVFPSDALTVATGAQPFRVPFEELEPVSLRQAALALFSQKTLAATDCQSLAVEAARLSAKVCEADCFSFAQQLPDSEKVTVWWGRLGESSVAHIESEEQPMRSPQDSLDALALSMQRPVTIANLAEEERCRDQHLVGRGVATALACPLRHPGISPGVLGLYRTQASEFAYGDVFFLESIANVTAVALARQAAQDTVAQQSKKLAEIVNSSETVALELSAQGRILDCNPALERTSGFRIQELKDRTFYSAFVLPGELEEVQQALANARDAKGTASVECYILTKEGSRRRVKWTFTNGLDAEGQRRIKGLGTDITEQHEMAQRLQLAEAMADNAVQTLRALRDKAQNRELSSPMERQVRVTMRRDRRCQTRRSFPYRQFVAPIFGERLPEPEKFHEVRCRNLSARGFSFESASIPAYHQLLVAFGQGKDLIYLTAKIIHVTPQGKPGEEPYLIGCRFTGRARHPAAS
jgi:PAS domain S-box-containing protein